MSTWRKASARSWPSWPATCCRQAGGGRNADGARDGAPLSLLREGIRLKEGAAAQRALQAPLSSARRAFRKTAANMGRVSRPVKVFCWLGWNEQRIVRPAGSGTSTP